MILGSRVVRGPDWKWQEQDGGEGNVGTITSITKEDDGEDLPNQMVQVRWDNGHVNRYRVGGGGYDLRIFDSSPSGVVFADTKCNGCSHAPIQGALWKCHDSDDCVDYHLCTKCYMNDEHSLEHLFTCIPHQYHAGILVNKRSAALKPKIQARGIFPGAVLVRLNEEARVKYGKGKVNKVLTEGTRNGMEAIVQWEKVMELTTHNLGRKSDVTLVESAEGPLYYRSHLPLVVSDDDLHPVTLGFEEEDNKKENDDGTANMESLAQALSNLKDLKEVLKEKVKDAVTSKENEPDKDGRDNYEINKSNLKVGNKVVIHLKKDEEKLYESNLNKNEAAKFVGEIGKITEVKPNGGVSVQFKALQENWSFPDPSLFSKISKLCPGDVVRLTDNIFALKKMQEGHGGFDDDMQAHLNKTGVVEDINKKGTATVNFDGTSWYLNSAVVIRESNLEGRTDEDENNGNGSEESEEDEIDEDLVTDLLIRGHLHKMEEERAAKEIKQKPNAQDQAAVNPDADDVYKMKSSPRGLMVIINMTNFTPLSGLNERKGSEKDETTLKDVFKEFLHFEVWIWKNKERTELLQELKNISRNKENTRYDCLAMCIMSHGEGDAFFTTDSRSVKLQEVFTLFTNTDCEVFRHKPKLFFIQACRGDLGSGFSHTYMADAPLDVSESLGSIVQVLPETRDPDMADMMIVYSSFEGYAAHRDIKQGSFFIQKLAKVFREFADKEHIADLLTRVNYEVHSDVHGLSGRTQVPAPTFTLRKKLYFWPGITFDNQSNKHALLKMLAK